MAEYIERERIRKALVSACLMSQNCPMFIAAKIDQMIDCEPAADVAPVVHGHWIRQDESFTRFKCSNPECGIENCSGFENYCPNCGAKMDIDEEGDM